MINPNYTISRDGNVIVVNDFLIPEVATKMHEGIKGIPREWWYRSMKPINENGEKNDLLDTPYLSLRSDFQEKHKNLLSVYENGGFAYTFRRTIDDHFFGCTCSLCRTVEFFRSDVAKEAFSKIIGTNIVGVNEMFASKYEKGDFLTIHHDKNNGEYAFVYQLTKDWNPAFGGNLEFYDYETQQIYKSVMPRFNSLNIFRIKNVKSDHLVSMVTVNKQRFAFSGWLKEQV